jgi:glutamate-1-semialdehyde 2,1-aminomutase
MPYGVSSNFRYWGDDTPVIARAEKAHVYDVDGNCYIDYRLGFGPIIIGHANPTIVSKVASAMASNSLTATTNPIEIAAARRMVEMCPGIEKVRFTNSGTEASMHALRVARAYTGRDCLIKFEGNYHGVHDQVLWTTASAARNSLGSRRSPVPVAAGSGIPRGLADYVIMLPYNDFEALERVIEDRYSEIAAVIFEPMMGNSYSIEPAPGWIKFIRKLCDDYGIVMIMDEVKTGFRVAPGGAQELYGVNPDLATYAKALGNGFPVAAFGGKAELMDSLQPGSVAQSGTYAGNPFSTAAAEATLDLLQNTDALDRVRDYGAQLMTALGKILSRYNVPHVFSGHPSMFGLIMGTDRKPRDYRDTFRSAKKFYEHVAFEMYERGVMIDPDGREPWFICAEHSPEDMETTLLVFEEAIETVTSYWPDFDDEDVVDTD